MWVFCVARRQCVQAFCFVAWGRLLFFGVMAAGGTWLNYFASCWAEHHASLAAMLIDVFSLIACKEISEGKIDSSCQRALKCRPATQGDGTPIFARPMKAKKRIEASSVGLLGSPIDNIDLRIVPPASLNTDMQMCQVLSLFMDPPLWSPFNPEQLISGYYPQEWTIKWTRPWKIMWNLYDPQSTLQSSDKPHKDWLPSLSLAQKTREGA